MSEVETSLIVKVDGSGAETETKKIERSLNDMEGAGNRAAASSEKVSKAAQGTVNPQRESAAAAKEMAEQQQLASERAELLGARLGTGLMIGVRVAMTLASALITATTAIITMSEKVQGYKIRLGQVAKSQGEANEMFERTVELSNRTGQSIDSITTLYSRLGLATRDMVLETGQLDDMVSALSTSLRLSNASTGEANSVILQFSQAVASGTLRGQEFISVTKGAPVFVKALGDALGKTSAELKDMADNGELTTEVLLGAATAMNDEFASALDDMGRTSGLALGELRNNLLLMLGAADTTEAVEFIDQFNDILSDPQVRSDVQLLTQFIVDLTVKTAQLVVEAAKLPSKFEWLDPLRMMGFDFDMSIGSAGKGLAFLIKKLGDMGLVVEDVDELTEAMRRVDGATAEIITKQAELVVLQKKLDGMKPTSDGFEEMAAQAKKLKGEIETLTESHKAQVKVRTELNEVDVLAIKTSGKMLLDKKALVTEIDKQIVANEKLRAATADLIEEQEFEYSMLGKTTREVVVATAERRLNASATDEQRAAYGEMAGALYDAAEAEKQAAIQAEYLREQMEESVPATNVWAEAMEAAVERVDAAFADAWRGAFDGFSEFRDGILNGFKQMLAEMAHMAITKPIMIAIGTALTGGGVSGAASAASGASGLGGLGSLLSIGTGGSLISGIAGAGSALGLGAQTGAFLGSTGQLGYNALSALGIQGAGGTTSFLAGGALTAGAGILGGMAGNALGSSLTGRTSNSNWGAGIGGTAGAFLGGHWGAAIGGAIGGALDSAFGSSKNRIGGVGINTGTREANLWGTKRGEYQDPMKAVSAAVLALSAAVGGSGTTMTISRGNKSPLKLDDVVYNDIESLMDEVLNRIIKTATDMVPVVKELALLFEGDLGQRVDYINSLRQLTDLVQINPVGIAAAEFAAELEASGRTIAESYSLQIGSINEMIDSYDGSTESTQALSSALLLGQAAAYEMALAIQVIAGEIDKMTTDTAAYFRDSVLTAEELTTQRQSQLDSAVSELDTALDPERIAELVGSIAELSRSLFNAIPEDERADRAEEFAVLLESTNEIAQRQLELATETLSKTQDEVNARVMAMLDDQAAKMAESAANMAAATNSFQMSAAQIQAAVAAGFNVNVRIDSSGNAVLAS